MLPWTERPAIAIDLGKRLRDRYLDVPPAAIAVGKELLAAIKAQIPEKARILAYWIAVRTRWRFQREFRAYARLIEADWRDIALGNITYDLVMSTLGCSTIALPTPKGPVVARNMDWFPERILAKSSYVFDFQKLGESQLRMAGFPGSVGVVTGLSQKGFAVVLNAVTSPEPRRKMGYPVLLHLRRVLEDARGFDEAVARLSKQKITTSALFTVAGTENHQRVVIERTPTRAGLRWAKPAEPLFATNDYRLLFPPEQRGGLEIYQTTCGRYDALCRFFASHNPDRHVDNEALLYILSDPSVIQTITAQHIIMCPRTSDLRLWVPSRLLEPESSHGTP